MNAFANPEDASIYEFPEFPAPEREQTQFNMPEGVQAGSFVDFETSLQQSQEQAVSVVQSALFQDFKEVLPQPEA